MSRTRAVSYWCLPRAEDSAPLEEVIARLAARQKAPIFAPHMTLGTCLAKVDIPTELRASLRDLRLSVIEIGETNVFTTALFLRLALTPNLRSARAMFDTLPHFRAGRAFDPHLSLCYGSPPADAAQSPAISGLIGKEICFDRLAVIEVSLPVATYDDVRSWRTLDVIDL